MNNLLAGATNSMGSETIQNSILKGTLLETLQQGTNSPLGSAGFLSVFVPRFIGLLLVFGGLAFFFMFLWGAITWIISGGDKASVENAKGRITNALIGLILMVGVFAIAKLIESFFGIDILSIDIGPLVIQ